MVATVKLRFEVHFSFIKTLLCLTNNHFSANHNSLLGVSDITNIKPDSSFSDVKYSPSNTALAIKWHIVQAQGLRPIWCVKLILIITK